MEKEYIPIKWRDTTISSHEKNDNFSIVKNGKGEGWVLIDPDLNKTIHQTREEAKKAAEEINKIKLIK